MYMVYRLVTDIADEHLIVLIRAGCGRELLPADVFLLGEEMLACIVDTGVPQTCRMVAQLLKDQCLFGSLRIVMVAYSPCHIIIIAGRGIDTEYIGTGISSAAFLSSPKRRELPAALFGDIGRLRPPFLFLSASKPLASAGQNESRIIR